MIKRRNLNLISRRRRKESYRSAEKKPTTREKGGRKSEISKPVAKGTSTDGGKQSADAGRR